MKSKWNLLSVVIAWTAITSSHQQCPNLTTGKVTPALPLPKLPTNNFKAVVRGQIIDQNVTIEGIEWADEDLQKGAVKIDSQDSSVMMIMSYGDNLIYEISPSNVTDASVPGPQQCIALPINASPDAMYFGMGINGSSMHMYSTSRILEFMNGSEVFKGQKTVDGIPANQWSSCVTWSSTMNATFLLDYYFTVPGWITPGGLDQVPLRAEIQGTRTYPNGTKYTFHHIYQYVNFEPYSGDPKRVFTTPPGVQCLLQPHTLALPTLPTQFYYREEIINPPTCPNCLGSVSESDIYYDYTMKLIRFDSVDEPPGASLENPTGPYTVIHDYNVGIQYTTDRSTKNCAIDPLPTGAAGFDNTMDPKTHFLSMRNPLKFFNLNATTFFYVGKRLARGLMCNVYQNSLNNFVGDALALYEVYFLPQSDTDNSDRAPSTDVTDESNNNAIPFRLLIWTQGKLQYQYEIHDFTAAPPSSHNFDIANCYDGSTSKDFEIAFRTRDTLLMPQLSDYVIALANLMVAANTIVSPIRLQKTLLHWGENTVFYQATLLDTPPEIAKYTKTANTSVSTNLKKTTTLDSSALCAKECDLEANCTWFDYCSSSQSCTFGRANNDGSSQSTNAACDHYQRVMYVGASYLTSLYSAWNSLKNTVYKGPMTITLPLPDQNGKVDLTKNTDDLDSTQKIKLTAFRITDEISSSFDRNSVSGTTMNDFSVRPNFQAKGYKTAERGYSVDDCATDCVNELTYNCQSFSYCWSSGTCFLSTLHPDEDPTSMKPNSNCDVYIRNYTSNYQRFPGLSVLSYSNVIYQRVASDSQCAKLCSNYDGFHCESFDFCEDSLSCFLSNVHYYDQPVANIKQMPNCMHYSRDYSKDFKITASMVVPMNDNRVVQGVSVEQCARLCVEEDSFNCKSFDYCGNYTECRLSDASTATDGQVSLESSAYCDVHTRVEFDQTWCTLNKPNGASPVEEIEEESDEEIGSELEVHGASPTACPGGWLSFQKYCYYVNNQTKITWDEASRECETRLSQLLRVNSVDEFNFIKKTQKAIQSDSYWTALNNLPLNQGPFSKTDFMWMDNGIPDDNIVAQNWDKEPDNVGYKDCASMNYGGAMSMTDCSERHAFICQIAMPQSGCPMNFTEGYNGDWCFFISNATDWTQTVNWNQAKTKCGQLNSQLLSMTTRAQQIFVSESLPFFYSGRQVFWTGLNDKQTEGTLVWDGVTGTTNLGFIKWRQEPNNLGGQEHCGALLPNGKWGDFNCEDTMNYICRRDQLGNKNGLDMGCGVWTRAGKKCIMTYNLNNTWDAAQEYCYSVGGHLLRFDSKADASWLLVQGSSFLRYSQLPGYWIGLTNNNNAKQWQWTDGTKPNPSVLFWDKEPHEGTLKSRYCTVMTESLRFVVKDCTRQHAMPICEEWPNSHNCNSSWVLHNSHCYLFDTKWRSRAEALTFCKHSSVSGHAYLVTISNTQELNWLKTQISTQGWVYWTGLMNDNNQGWYWENPGQNVDPVEKVVSWDYEPNNFGGNEHCVEIMQNGYLNDENCNRTANGFICQKIPAGINKHQPPVHCNTGSGTNTGSQGTNTGNQGTNTGNQGTNTGNQGTNTGNQGTNTGNQGTNTGNQGTNTGNQGSNTNTGQGTYQKIISTQTTGYSGGSMGGLAIGMLLIGALVCLGLQVAYTVFVKKRRAADGLTVSFVNPAHNPEARIN